MRKWLSIITGVFFVLICISCKKKEKQTYTPGTATIIADESFEPIIEDELYVFRSSYPKWNIKVIYKPENELLNLLLNDSTGIAIMSRMLSQKEIKAYENKNIRIRVNRFAIDGIALVVNKSSKDSTIELSEIVKVMQGKAGKIESLVFDNANSSTVRYLKELSGIKVLPESGIYALASNREVIKFVAEHPGMIGVIGINWIRRTDTATEQYVSKLRVIGIKNLAGKPGSDKFYTPDQNNLALGLYPLKRDLYIINCQGGAGLGSGFISFLAGERGQRIVLKSGLLPDSLPTREIRIKKEF